MVGIGRTPFIVLYILHLGWSSNEGHVYNDGSLQLGGSLTQKKSCKSGDTMRYKGGGREG